MTKYTTSQWDRFIGQVILRVAQLGVVLILLLFGYAVLSLSILAE